MSKGKKAKPPVDPDPTPMDAAPKPEEQMQAQKDERRRMASNYGRNKTILAGNSTQENAAKKTILGN